MIWGCGTDKSNGSRLFRYGTVWIISFGNLSRIYKLFGFDQELRIFVALFIFSVIWNNIRIYPVVIFLFSYIWELLFYTMYGFMHTFIRFLFISSSDITSFGLRKCMLSYLHPPCSDSYVCIVCYYSFIINSRNVNSSLLCILYNTIISKWCVSKSFLDNFVTYL